MHFPSASIILLVSLTAAFSTSSLEPLNELHPRDAYSLAKAQFLDAGLHSRSADPYPFAAPDADADLKLKLAISHLVRRALVARGKKPDLKLPKTDIHPKLRDPAPPKNDPKAKAAYSAGQADHHKQGLQNLKDKGAQMPDPKNYKKDGGAYSSGRPPFFDKVKYQTGYTPSPIGFRPLFTDESEPKRSQPHSQQGQPKRGTGFSEGNQAPTHGHWWNQ